MAPKRRPALVRFEAMVKKTETCWMWGGATLPTGYGLFRDDLQRLRLVHRWVYEHFVGPIQYGFCVCHTCDVRCCVNPAHLWLGTYAENTADMHDKGRAVGNRKLTWKQVERIRADADLGPTKLALRHGVTRRAIHNVLAGKTWVCEVGV